MNTFKLVCAAILAASLFASPVLAMEHKVGLGFGYVPDYEGSEDYTGIPLFMLQGKYDSGRSFTLRGTNLNVNLVPSRQYSFGPVLNYRMGRDDVDNPQVDRMKDIDPAFEVGFFGGLNINNWLLGFQLLADVSNEYDGQVAELSAGYRWKAAPSLTIVPKVSTAYADGDYMNTYFGVNSRNRGTSTLPGYSAERGFKDVGINLAIDYTPWEHWGLSGVLAYSTLLGDAKDSPLVDGEGDGKQMFFGLMGTYRWGK